LITTAAGSVKLGDDPFGRVQVEQVGERQLLPLDHVREIDQGLLPVPGGLLVRVLTVRRSRTFTRSNTIREPKAAGASPALRVNVSPPTVISSKRRADHRVVRGRVGEHLPCQREPERRARAGRHVERVQHRGVVLGTHDDQHAGEVLGRCP